jgi:hypothetical protein
LIKFINYNNYRRKEGYTIKRLKTIILLSSLLLVCTNNNGNNDQIQFDIAKCKAEREAFLKSQPASYSYVFSYCNQKPFFKLFVKNGRIDSISIFPEYSDIDTFFVSNHLIDSIFSEIIYTYESYPGLEKKDEDYYVTGISCNYDSLFHFPVNWEYTFHQGSGEAFLSGCFRIDSFTVLSK